MTAYMHQGCVQLSESKTVSEAMASLRASPPQERIVYLYVVDEASRLVGVVPTRRLLLSAPDTPLADIMVRNVVAVPAGATVLDACEFFIQHRLLALPVVGADRRILGVVDVELYTDEITDLADAEARNDLFHLVGVNMSFGSQASPLTAFRHRVPWLGANLTAGILAAFISGVYEDVLHKVVALAFFIPVVLNLAESVSSQSVSLALAALHGRRPKWKSLAGGLRREFATGLILGLAAGAAVALTALIWLGQWRVAACLVGGIASGVMFSAVIGLAMPTLLRLLRLEPRVAAGPIALAAADVVTILIYLNLASWLLG